MDTILGQNQITPGTATYPTKVQGDGTATNLLTIQPGSATPPTGQVPIRVRKDDGTVVWEMTWDDGMICYNMRVGAHTPLGVWCSGIDGTQDPPCFVLGDKTTTDDCLRLWMDDGAPGAGTVGAARVNDLYLRNDGTAGSTALYKCTGAGTGAASTWTGIA